MIMQEFVEMLRAIGMKKSFKVDYGLQATPINEDRLTLNELIEKVSIDRLIRFFERVEFSECPDYK